MREGSEEGTGERVGWEKISFVLGIFATMKLNLQSYKITICLCKDVLRLCGYKP